jgi:hypothetical protein
VPVICQTTAGRAPLCCRNVECDARPRQARSGALRRAGGTGDLAGVRVWDDGRTAAAVYRSGSESDRRDTIAASVAGGLLDRQPDGTVRASERSRQFLADLFALRASTLTDHWDATFVDRLKPLLARLLAAGTPTAGPAWAVQAPPFESDGLAPAVVLLNRLSTMRYHRADAHAAAWEAAGCTAAEFRRDALGNRVERRADCHRA